jgi:hypothetical protein
MDGFPNAHAWEQHFRNVLYPGLSAEAKMYRLQFRLDEMERDISALAPRQEPETERVEVG